MRDSACHPSCIPAYQAFVLVWANVRPFLYPPCTPGTCPSFSKHKILFLTHIVSWAPVPVWESTRLFTSTLHTKHLSQFHQTLDCSHQLVYHYQAYVPVCANTKPFHALYACTVCTVHGALCALFMVHCVFCSWCTVCTVHGALCVLFMVHCALFMVHCVHCSWCTVCSVHGALCALFMVHCVFCSWCTVCTVHGALCALFMVHCVLCSWCTVCTVHGALCALFMVHCVHCSWCTVCTVCTVPCTVCTWLCEHAWFWEDIFMCQV